MNCFLKKIFFVIFAFSSCLLCFAKQKSNEEQITNETLKSAVLPFPKWWEPANLNIFKQAYPEFSFNSFYDNEKKDWKIFISKKSDSKTQEKPYVLYWCESRFLPEDELENKENYRPLLYKYRKTPANPEFFTEEEIERIKNFTSRENRKNGAVDSPFLYDIIYDCRTQRTTESHIVKVDFLTKSVNVHEKIKPALTRVSEKIMALEKDEELSNFFKTLNRTDGFVWRTVRDTQSRSFHSIGLAVDILPNGYYQKIIYWAWQKQLRPDDWYMTPLSKRWTPPQKIIDIFFEEGFIWGGTWAVWDNMHFEYHPELLLYSRQ